MAVPPDDFPNLVHSNDVSNQPDFPDLIHPIDASTQSDSIGLIPLEPHVPDVVLVRQSSRPHKPPTYLRDYHCNLVAAPLLASAALSQSDDSIDPSLACWAAIFGLSLSLLSLIRSFHIRLSNSFASIFSSLAYPS
nr:hypothetical protein CFP56_55502 [Quercus suber]